MIHAQFVVDVARFPAKSLPKELKVGFYTPEVGGILLSAQNRSLGYIHCTRSRLLICDREHLGSDTIYGFCQKNGLLIPNYREFASATIFAREIVGLREFSLILPDNLHTSHRTSQNLGLKMQERNLMLSFDFVRPTISGDPVYVLSTRPYSHKPQSSTDPNDLFLFKYRPSRQ